MENDDLKCEVVKEDFSQFDYSYKLIVIGDISVGKSCLTMKATKDYFETYYAPTVGFEFYTFNCKVDSQNIRLQIWDTCGQEEYRSLIQNFYRNASLAIIVYSIDNKSTFENVQIWLNEIKIQSNPDVKIFLIGNKIDLEQKREVTTKMGQNFCKENHLDLFFETSAKDGTNVIELFCSAAKLLYQEQNKYKDRASRLESIIKLPSGENENNDVIDNEEEKPGKKGCCKG